MMAYRTTYYLLSKFEMNYTGNFPMKSVTTICNTLYVITFLLKN